MTAEFIKQMIEEEIKFKDFRSWHSISKSNILNCLVYPIKIDFVNAWDDNTKKYWIVFDETPQDKISGYQIVYDEEENMFGLATKTTIESKEIGAVTGLHGSFIDTINNM